MGAPPVDDPADQTLGVCASMVYIAGMQYRQFGCTELQMPALTCGGMRFQQTWDGGQVDKLDTRGQENLEATVRYAVDNGINHIETARGYGSSEYQLGLVLPSLPRKEIIVQTKIGPKDSEDEFLRAFETSLRNLRLDYVDLFGIHGINTMELLSTTLEKGSLKACRKLQDQGLIRHVGFSTHGSAECARAVVETGEFAYMNLHWYYFDQRNWPAIAAAQEREMGVFIISPSDKGGKLYDPPGKLVDLCRPLHPMAFNDLFCLSHSAVHTISIGASRPADLDLHLNALTHLDVASEVTAPIAKRLDRELAACMGAEWASDWQDGLPPTVYLPEEIPLYHILRMVNMAKAFDMIEYGKMRYNLLGSGGHWFPGQKVDKVNWAKLPAAIAGYRFADRIPDLLHEAHAMFNAEDAGRLSQS